MVYRIRYRLPRQDDETETVVEANSPTEAMVKFRCIHDAPECKADLPEQVTSVCAEDTGSDW